MFNIIERHQKVVKGIMIAITATFVVWGIGGYLGMSGDDGYVAKVGSNKIYSQDIDRAIDQNSQQNQDKMQVLFGLINRQLLLNALNDNHLTVTTSQLQEGIAAIPLFQTNGVFDVSKYQNFLKQRYTTSAKFEQDIGQQILVSQMVDFFKSSYFTSATFQSKFAALLSRQRNVSQYVVDPKQFYAKINLSESDISAFYQQNISKFTIPDQVKLDYIQLSADGLAANIKVSDDEVSKYLLDHPKTGANEQIDVSHILFTVSDTATAQQRAQVKANAAQVLAQVQANPAKFAELAKQYSQDPGSAQNGGDLGYFGRGVMVKAFESVAFAMKKGQLSGLVETQYGYHILKLNDIKVNDVIAQRNIALQQIQKQKATQELQSKVDQLNDLTYNHPDSLEPAAKKTGLSVQSTPDWVAKGVSQGQFANPKLQQAIFSPEVLNKRHNSEVVDLGTGSYIVVRVSNYQPARQKPLAEVKSQVVDALKQQQATQMAAGQGQMDVGLLKQGKLSLDFKGSENVTLLGQSPSIDPMAIKQVFAVPATFPAYTGAVNQAGAFVVYRINSQSTDNSLDKQNQAVVDQLASQYAMMTLNSYVGSLRSEYKVSYKLDRIKANDAAVSGN